MNDSIPQLVTNLANRVVKVDAGQRAINLANALVECLENAGCGLRSTEIAEQWKGRLYDEVEKALLEWDKLGVPRPLVPCGTSDTLLTLLSQELSKLHAR